MRKYLFWRFFGGIVIVASLILLLGGAEVSPPVAHAASFTHSPSVVIVEDLTNLGHCTRELTRTRGKQVSKSAYTCLPGTFLQSTVVPLAQALAQHESYVLLPDAITSPTEKQQIATQVEQLIAQKRLELRQSIQPNPATIHPDSCGGGSTYEWASNFSFYGDTLAATVTWYVPTNCGNITIDNATLEADTYYNTANWQQTCYEDPDWTVGQTCFQALFSNQCMLLAPPGSTPPLYIDQSFQGGGDFEFTVSPDLHCWPPTNLDTFDIGTLFG